MAIDRETQVMTDATAAGITRPKELANFMAQVAHESNGLNRLDESFRYTKGIAQIPVKSAWRQGPQVLDAARKQALQGKPESLAELMYGGRNGNDQPGDGWKYHGRGYIQLTGKDNYRAAGKALDLDLVHHPELAADPKYASKIAVWYWMNHVPETAREDVKAATRAVNGKYNGLDDREERFAEWQKRLTPAVMERLSGGQVGHAIPTREDPSHSGAKAATPLAGKIAAPTATSTLKIPTPHAGPALPILLSEGSRGDDVRRLQSALSELGYRDADRKRLKVDGHFGPATKSAVKAYQASAELPADGEVNRDMMNFIEYAQDKSEFARQRRHHHHPPAPCPFSNPSHPDHTLFNQAREAVHRLDARHHRTPDERSENLAAALTVSARKEGLTRIDHVTLSDDAKRTYAVQGDLNSPLKRTAEVETQKAVATPIVESVATPATKATEHENTQQQAHHRSTPTL